MTVQNMIDICHFTVFTQALINKSVTGCYIGDVLSLAMTRLQAGEVWLTVQSNINIAAVAALTGSACIILAEHRHPETDTLQAAAAHDVTILGTEHSLYQTACQLYTLGIGEENKAL